MLQVGFEPHPGGVQGDSLSEGEHGLHVQLFGPLPVLLHLCQGEALVELVELIFVGFLIDCLLVDEGFEELVLAALQLGDLALGGGSLGRDVLPPGFPDIEDDPPEEGQELGARPELLQESAELGLQLGARDVRPAAVGGRRAMVVGVAPVPALRPGARERLLAVAAGHECSEGEVRVVALLGYNQAIGLDEALAAPKNISVDQRWPVAIGVDAPGGLVDAADVEPVRQHLSPLLLRQLAAPQRAEAVISEDFENLRAGVEAGGEALEAEPHERCPLRVELHGLAVREIAQGRLPDPLAATQSLLHAGFRPAAADLIVELREGREDALHEFAGWRFVDRLAYSPQGHAEPRQMSADDRMVEGVTGKPVHVRDHENVNLHAAPVLLAQVGQRGLKLGTVCCLRGLAALQEDPIHFPAVQAAEGPALVFLDWKGEVEGLLFAADSAVDDCPERGHPEGSLEGREALSLLVR